MARNLLSKPICHFLLVIVLGIIGYSNTLDVPFQFDDLPNIVNNPIIRNLDYYHTPSKAKEYKGLAEYPLLINRYIGSLSIALNYKINGLNVAGYHQINLLIHIINALLIYWFVQLIFINLASGAGGANLTFLRHAPTVALTCSLIFVTHPIETQAVTYIIQRFTSLATMFYLFSIIMYVKARILFDDGNIDTRRGKINTRAFVYYLVALFTAVLAMKTKEISFTLPTMIVLYEFLFFKEEMKNRIKYLFPFTLTMLIIPITLLYVADMSGGIGTATRLLTETTRLDYLFTEFRVIMTYIRLVFLPVDQNLDYDYPLSRSIFEPEVFMSFTALLIIILTVIYFFWRYRRTHALTRVILFGTAWFFVTLSVESSFIPIVDVIFEHRMYLPTFGMFLVISVLLMMVIEKFRQKWVEVAIVSAVILTALVFTGVTYSRNSVWHDKITMWQDVVDKSPAKARGYAQLGGAYREKGDYHRAIYYFTKATSLEPFASENYVLLGVCLDEFGRTKEAIKAFESALRIKPDFAEAHNSLGVVLGKLGRTDEAIKEFREVVRIKPDLAEVHNNLGISLYRLGQTDEAIEEFREALRIKPDFAKARNNLGSLLGKLGRTNESSR